MRSDDLHRPVDDRERAQAEEVELHEAGGFDVVLVELGDDVLRALFAVERRKVREHGGRDHDATGVLAGVARAGLRASERGR